MAKIDLSPAAAENLILQILANIVPGEVDVDLQLALEKILPATMSTAERKRHSEAGTVERKEIRAAKLVELQTKAQDKAAFAELQETRRTARTTAAASTAADVATTAEGRRTARTATGAATTANVAQASQQAQAAQAQATVDAAIARGDAIAERQVRQATELPAAQAEGTLRGQAVTTAAEAVSPASLRNLEIEAKATVAISKGRVLNPLDLERQHTALLTTAVNQPEVKQRLEALVTSRTSQAQTLLKAAGARAGVSSLVINAHLDVVERLNMLTPAGTLNLEGKRLVGSMVTAHQNVIQATAQLTQGNVQVLAGATGEVSVLPTAGTPKRMAAVVSKVTPEITKGIGLLASGEGAVGKATVANVLNVLKQGAGRSGLLVGGLVGGALLLPSIISAIGGGKDEQQELSPQAQIELLQALAQLKSNETLTESLAGSRQASAAKNLAQADLLRLQALQFTGGGGGLL